VSRRDIKGRRKRRGKRTKQSSNGRKTDTKNVSKKQKTSTELKIRRQPSQGGGGKAGRRKEGMLEEVLVIPRGMQRRNSNKENRSRKEKWEWGNEKEKRKWSGTGENIIGSGVRMKEKDFGKNRGRMGKHQGIRQRRGDVERLPQAAGTRKEPSSTEKGTSVEGVACYSGFRELLLVEGETGRGRDHGGKEKS